MSTYTYRTTMFGEPLELEFNLITPAEAAANAHYLTPAQYAKVSGQHAASIRRNLRKGNLQGKRIDGKWYVRVSRHLFDMHARMIEADAEAERRELEEASREA